MTSFSEFKKKFGKTINDSPEVKSKIKLNKDSTKDLNRIKISESEKKPFVRKEVDFKSKRLSKTSPIKLNSKLSSCLKESKVKHKPHQISAIKNILNKKGLIVMHGTGSGKGLTAITALKCELESNPELKAIIIAPTSVIDNMRREMRLAFPKMDTNDPRIEFFTINKFTKLFSDNPEYCKDKFLIIDEAHNLKTEIKELNRKEGEEQKFLKKRTGFMSNTFIQACKFAYKVMLLTATPVMNRPSEMINLIAMVDGKEPMSKREFNSEIFNDKTGEIPNMISFRKFFKDKVHIYGCDKKDSTKGEEGYPTSKITDIEFEMDRNYYKKYYDIQEGESKKYSHLFGGTKDLTVFYNGVRRASNTIGEDESPKIEWILNKIKEARSAKSGTAGALSDLDKSLVYSSFITSGMKLIARKLEEEEIPYLYISGKLSKSRRRKVVESFNSGEVRVLLISKAGGEGLDLKGVKNIIITEPPWNESTTKQIIGRGVRDGSHKGEDDKHVNIYKLYMKKPPVKKRISGDNMEAIDIYLKNFGGTKQEGIDKFVVELKKVSC